MSEQPAQQLAEKETSQLRDAKLQQEQLDANLTTISEMQQKIDTLSIQLDEATNIGQEQLKAVHALEEDKANYTKRADQDQQLISELDKQIVALREESARLISESAQLQLELTEQRQSIAEGIREISDLRQQLTAQDVERADTEVLIANDKAKHLEHQNQILLEELKLLRLVLIQTPT